MFELGNEVDTTDGRTLFASLGKKKKEKKITDIGFWNTITACSILYVFTAKLS